MAHRGRPRGRGISQSQRRKKTWAALTALPSSSSGPDTGTALSPTINLVLPSTAAPQAGDAAAVSSGVVFDLGESTVGPESTLLRLRGSLELPKNDVQDGAGAIQGITTHAFGVGVMESSAAALGAFPNPASPLGSDWDGWMFYRSQEQGALDANAGIVDVKSMRKLQGGYSLILVFGAYKAPFDALDIVFAGDVEAFFTLRGLFLLP